MIALLPLVGLAATVAFPVVPPERKPNPGGVVLVTEYHNVSTGKGMLFRSPKEFEADLNRLYSLGFRPITARQWLSGGFTVKKGTSPVIMTFDDSIESQLKFDAKGKVDPNCAVGIWMRFARKHPDFPVRGTFFVLPGRMFDQKAWRMKKAKLLLDLGCELASHTVTHRSLRKLTDAQVMKELADSYDFLEKLGAPMPPTLAYPYGESPKNPSLVGGFTYKKKEYKYLGGFLAGADPSPNRANARFRPHAIPRVQACTVEMGLDWWLNRIGTPVFRPYVAP